MFENSKVYDTLKWLASPGLPAVATLLITVSQIVNINAFAIAGAIVAAIGACFGEWTGQASKKFFEAHNIVPVDDASPILPEDTVTIKAEEIE